MKKTLMIVITVLLIGGVIGTIMIQKLNRDVEQILNEEITEFNLNIIADGTYEGTYDDVLTVSATLRVTVENNSITNIEIIEHQNGQGQAAEGIITHIIAQQSIMVDDIAGATYSSRVLKLAIYNALKEE